MEAEMNAVETTGTVDENRQLHLDRPLPIPGPAQVRVIVLYPGVAPDIDESEWLKAAATNPALDFLRDEREDVYTRTDGRAFCDEA